MGLINNNPPVKPTPPQEPYVTEKPYVGSEVDSERTPVSSLLPYVKGTPWQVDYYRQYLTKDEEASSEQVTREAVYQQYQLIRQFEFRVTSPLSTDFDEESGEHSMSGSANIYPSFKPIKGDMFTADLFDGRAGLFTIKDVRQKTIFQDSTYEVDYEIVDFLNDRRKHDLESKVVVHTVFVRDFALNQQNPLVLEEEWDTIQQLRKGVDVLCKQYFWALYNQETKSFPIPKQRVATYDQFLIKFVDYAFPVSQRDTLKEVTKYYTGGDPSLTSKTFWDLLIESDDSFEGFIVKEFDTISTRHFGLQPTLNSIAYSRFDRLLFPKDKDLNDAYLTFHKREADHQRLDSPYSLEEWGEMELRYAVRRQILNGLGEVPPADLYVPLIHPVGIDDYYVLTEYFYNQAIYGQSQLELQTRALIKGNRLDASVLLKLLKDVPNWGPMEMFYYVPLLAFLIRKAIGGF